MQAKWSDSRAFLLLYWGFPVTVEYKHNHGSYVINLGAMRYIELKKKLSVKSLLTHVFTSMVPRRGKELNVNIANETLYIGDF